MPVNAIAPVNGCRTHNGSAVPRGRELGVIGLKGDLERDVVGVLGCQHRAVFAIGDRRSAIESTPSCSNRAGHVKVGPPVDLDRMWSNPVRRRSNASPPVAADPVDFGEVEHHARCVFGSGRRSTEP
jgi:hypothetical protein